MEWISVKDRLPEEKYGQSYRKMATGTVAVIHKDRPDYPITAHAYYPMDDDMLFANAIPTNGASKYNYIEWHCCPELKERPINFGAGITHWSPLPEPPAGNHKN